MPNFLSPAVIAQEVQGNSGQIPVASTSTFALVGYSPRGPEDTPIVCNGFADFARVFGSFSRNSLNAYAAAAYFQNGGNQLVFVRHLHSDAAAAHGAFGSSWTVTAKGRGTWANNATVTISGNPNFVDDDGLYTAFDVTIALIDSVSGELIVEETYEALDFTDPTDSSYVVNVITAESQNVIFAAADAAHPVIPDGLDEEDADPLSITLTGGLNGTAVTSSDIVGAGNAETNKGIYALNLFKDQFQLALPDYAGDTTTIQSLIAYAENRGDVLVLCEPPNGNTPQQAVTFKRSTLKSITSYAAMYYPWVKVPDPLNNNRPKTIPPCGHVAGRYAYTDLNANVGKAPAGVDRGQLRWTTGLERVLAKEHCDLLYPAQINPIRNDSEVGTAIWGNRTLATYGDFTDVNIRRLFIYLRKVQEVGLLDILFEDVGPTTYGQITARLDGFLEGLYLSNVIGSGVTDKSQAYRIVCNESNNPAPVASAKRIYIDQAIKPNLATEVIWLRIQRVFDASQA